MVSRSVLIALSHPFITPKSNADIERRKHQLELVKRLRGQMSPASERMIDAFVGALQLRFHEGKGYSGFESVSREQIAEQLKHSSLYPHDIRLLRTLNQQQFIREKRQNLQVRYMLGADGQKLRQGAGFEYVYTMHPETLYCLLWHNPNHRLKLDELEQVAKRQAAHEERQRELKEFAERRAQTDAMLAALKHKPLQQPRTLPASKAKPKASLWDKITGRKP